MKENGKISNAIILCAGNSTRFGRDKLSIKFNGKSLPLRAVEFCVNNGIKNILITISKNNLFIDCENQEITSSIKSEIDKYKITNPSINIRYAFQSDDRYGPGAAVIPWLKSGYSENTIVLFGDNFYGGNMKFNYEDILSVGENGYGAIASVKKLKCNPLNLRLAVAIGDVLIEKPHSFLEGYYFCGFIIFSQNVINSNVLFGIKHSDRNEYEITDMFNIIPDRKFIDIDKIGITWSDITYERDIDNMLKIVTEYDSEN